MIPSADPASPVLHFVTPKQTAAPKDLPEPKPGDPPNPDLPLYGKDAVEFTATGISPENFAKLFQWDTGNNPRATVSGNTCKVSRSVPAGIPMPAPVILKLVTKTAPVTVHCEVRVWVIWSTCKAEKGTGEFIPLTRDGKNIPSAAYAVNGKDPEKAWRFTFTIDPPSICQISNAERPNLDGSDLKPGNPNGRKLSPVPGAAVMLPLDAQKPGDDATLKWDISRQVQFTVNNPSNLIPLVLQANGLPKLFYEGQPVPKLTPVFFPKGSAEGNDDSVVFPPDEDDNPYVAGTDARHNLTHDPGQIKSVDLPAFYAAQDMGGTGNSFGLEANFKEFARLELADGIRTSGTFWYRISDYTLWHHYLNTTFNPATKQWEKTDCSTDFGHPHK
jgi:hypothetical protein